MSELIVSTDPDFEARAKAIADRIGPILALAYPGYRWRVEPQIDQGIIDVRCEQTNMHFGHTFKLKHGIPDRQELVRAGGEILERFHRSRRKFDPAELPRDPCQFLPDL